MQNRFGLLSGIAAVGLLFSLTGTPTQAGQQQTSVLTNPENTLLGIQLLKSNFRDVLRRYGQPSEIQAGGPYLPTPPAGMKQNATGGMGGPGMPGMPGFGPGGPGMAGSGGGMGRKGMGGMADAGGPMAGGMGGPGGGGGGGGRKTTSKNGFPGKAGGGGGGAAGGGRGMGGPGGYPGMPGGMGYPGGPGGPGSSGGGLPGFGPGGPGGYGGPGAASGEGEGGGLGAGSQADENQPMYETTWWYHRPGKGEHFAFVFNRKGEVIQIGEYCSHPLTGINGRTRQGVDLNSPMGLVINKYGFSLDGAHDGDNVIMRYGGTNTIAFQMVKGRVLGITIGVVVKGRPSPVEMSGGDGGGL